MEPNNTVSNETINFSATRTDCGTEDDGCNLLYAQGRGSSNECMIAKDTENMERSEDGIFTPRLYKRRWIILFGYCLLSTSNMSSWFAFSAISNIVQEYYHIDLVQVNWLAIVFSIVSIILMFPSQLVLEKNGLAIIMVLASFFNALGCCIRYSGYSLPKYGYSFLLLGKFFLLTDCVLIKHCYSVAFC